MNENKWIEDLREKEREFNLPAPEGLWAATERRLAEETATRKKGFVVPLWVRYGGVAAAIVLVAVIGATLLTPSHLQDDNATMAAMPNPPQAKEEGGERGEASATLISATAQKPTATIIKSDNIRIGNLPRAITTDSVVNTPGHTDAATPIDPTEPDTTATPVTNPTPNNGPGQTPIPDNGKTYPEINPRRKSSSSGISVAVYSGNLMADAGSSKTGYAPMGPYFNQQGDVSYDPTSEVIDNNIMIMSQARQVRTKTQHKLPLRFGLNLAIPLAEKISLESGITYSILSSSTISGGGSDYSDSRQTLHYIGIPARIKYDIWKLGRFGIYISAGGMVEKCVYGRRKTTCMIEESPFVSKTKTVRDPRLQFSVTAAAGLKYDITERIGLFVEPGASYYIDNHSKVENSYKEHPLNFDIKAGIRFSISN